MNGNVALQIVLYLLAGVTVTGAVLIGVCLAIGYAAEKVSEVMRKHEIKCNTTHQLRLANQIYVASWYLSTGEDKDKPLVQVLLTLSKMLSRYEQIVGEQLQEEMHKSLKVLEATQDYDR